MVRGRCAIQKCFLRDPSYNLSGTNKFLDSLANFLIHTRRDGSSAGLQAPEASLDGRWLGVFPWPNSSNGRIVPGALAGYCTSRRVKERKKAP